MIIKILCPVCRAVNDLSDTMLSCRRCREDLSVLYAIKSYSYRARLYAIQQIAENAPKEGLKWLERARNLEQ